MTTHDRAAIISVGDELILGQTLDTNSKWISERLSEVNIRVVEHVTVEDDSEAQRGALLRLAARVRLVIVTGGLGPTADDLTRQALAGAMGDSLVTDDAALEAIEAMFRARGRGITDLQRAQAQRPSGGESLPNPHGTAPGLYGRIATGRGMSCDVFCLPGPPGEMRPMLVERVLPRLRPPEGIVVRTGVMHTLGLGEGELAQRLGALMDRSRNPLVGTTASGGVVSVRVRYEGPEAGADGAMRETMDACRAAAGAYAFGEGEETIMSATVDALRRHPGGGRLLVVESCTGGLLGSLLTSVPGSSDVFMGGWITYDNAVKRSQVGVPGSVLEAPGAVSAECARAMAEGALKADTGAGGTHAIAITGIAGPGGGTEAKPAGTVFIALSGAEDGGVRTEVRRFLFTGGREGVRDRAAKMAMAMLRFRLVGEPGVRLLWEVRG